MKRHSQLILGFLAGLSWATTAMSGSIAPNTTLQPFDITLPIIAPTSVYLKTIREFPNVIQAKRANPPMVIKSSEQKGYGFTIKGAPNTKVKVELANKTIQLKSKNSQTTVSNFTIDSLAANQAATYRLGDSGELLGQNGKTQELVFVGMTINIANLEPGQYSGRNSLRVTYVAD